MSQAPMGPPPGTGYRYVTQVFQTAGTYDWIAPSDIEDWTGVDLEVIAGGADGGSNNSSSGSGAGGGSGGGVRGTRRGFCRGQHLALVVGLKASTSSITIPAAQGGNMSATGGTAGAIGVGANTGTIPAGGAGGAGTGNTTGNNPTDEVFSGQSGADGIGGSTAFITCGVPSNVGPAGGNGADAPWARGLGGPGGGSFIIVNANTTGNPGKAGTGRGSGGGGGGADSAGNLRAGGTGQPGRISIGLWTMDPNYLDKVA